MRLKIEDLKNPVVEVAEDGWWLGRYDKDEMPFEEKQIVAA